MDKFEQKEMKKKSPTTNTWYDWLINYISEPIRKSAGGFKECLDKIKPYLKDIIIDLQESDILKIQLKIAINFIFSKNVEEERVMHSKRDNTEFMIYDNVNGIADEPFKTPVSRYQGNLEISVRGSDFNFDSVQLS